MLDQRRRRWTNTVPALAECLEFVGNTVWCPDPSVSVDQSCLNAGSASGTLGQWCGSVYWDINPNSTQLCSILITKNERFNFLLFCSHFCEIHIFNSLHIYSPIIIYLLYNYIHFIIPPLLYTRSLHNHFCSAKIKCSIHSLVK